MNTPDPSTMKEVLRGHDIGDAMDRLVEGMGPRKNPRQPFFRDNNCWKCRNGVGACAVRVYGR
jgi:hypothetical protein